MDWLTAPFRHAFMQHALLAAALVGVTCAVLGVHVVQRRMAFIGDALAHTTLPGLVVAHLFGWSLSLGGLAAALATALLIGWASRRHTVKEDTAIGVVFTGMFALGVLLMSRARSYRDLTHVLFGNVLGVTAEDLWFIGGVAALVLLTLALFHKELELTAFDPTHAEVIGLRADRMRFLLLGLLALAVVTGIQTVGVILTNALLVTPAATAALLSDRLPRRMLLGAALAAACSVAGLTLSYAAETSSGAAIVLCCAAAFVAAYAARSTWRRLRPDPARQETKDGPVTATVGEVGGGVRVQLTTRRKALAQLVFCQGCCCGREDRGRPAVPVERLKDVWRAEKLNRSVQLTISGCLGPCDAANVALLMLPGGDVWLGGISGGETYETLIAWARACHAAGELLPLPDELGEMTFARFRTEEVAK